MSSLPFNSNSRKILDRIKSYLEQSEQHSLNCVYKHGFLIFVDFLDQNYISGWHSGSDKELLQNKVVHDLSWPMNIAK